MKLRMDLLIILSKPTNFSKEDCRKISKEIFKLESPKDLKKENIQEVVKEKLD